MLQKFSDRLSRSAPLRHLLFLLAALIAIWGVGYRFGDFDQVFYVTFIRKIADPSLYPGDPFLGLRFFHYSYFLFAFVPLLRAGILEPAMFAIHIFATYLTFWMVWELSLTLFKNPLAALIGVVAFIFPHIASPGFPLIEDSLLPRTFVLPFLMLALIFYLRKRYWLAFLILGLMCNLHALTVAYVMAMVMLDCLLRWKAIGWKNILAGVAIFGIAASPVLYWKTGNTGIDLSLRPELLQVAARGTLTTLYYLVSTQPIILLMTLCGIGSLAMFLIARREHLSEYDRIMTNFVYAIGVVVVVQVITTYLLPITILVQMQILRIAFYLSIFGYLYFADLLARRLQEGSLSRLDAWVQVGTFIVVPLPFVPWIVWMLRKWVSKLRWRQVLVGALIGGGMVSTLVVGRVTDWWQPGYHVYAPQTAWVQAQLWARDNTPISTNFITPPQMYSQYVPDWRVFSERGTVVTLDELEDVPYVPSDLQSWTARFEALAPGAIARFDFNYAENKQYTAEAFYSLSARDLVRVARQYNASYLVVEKPHTYNFPIVYQNSGFVIYDLREAARAQGN